MEFPINFLPSEVLDIIFSNLSVPEKLNASLVCKNWLETLNRKSLLKDIMVCIKDNRAVPVFSVMSRNFLNFSFKFIIVDNNYHKLFKRFSSHIEYLSFENCENWKREPVNFEDLSYDNLKTLKISNCDLYTLFSSVPNLLEFYVNENCTMTDDSFSVLHKTMKHLKVLHLLCTVSCSKKVTKRFYPQDSTYKTNPSTCILSFPAVYDFISDRANSIKEIKFFHQITCSALKKISFIRDLHLFKIDLSGCNNCTDGLTKLFRNQPTLKVINLSNIYHIDDHIISVLSFALPDVQEILLDSCKITNRSLSKLFQLTNLSRLEIGGYRKFSAPSFNEAIMNFKPIKLKSLNLRSKIEDPDSIAFDHLFKQCKFLIYLDLSYNVISDTVIHIISENLVHLQYLCLASCNEITDNGLIGSHISLTNLKDLRILKLSNCHKITDNAVIEAIKFQYLEFLYVDDCDLKINTVQTLLLQNPRIKKIYCDFDNIQHPKIEKYPGLWPDDEYEPEVRFERNRTSLRYARNILNEVFNWM